MNITFVYKKNKKVSTYTSIDAIKRDIPDADLGYLYYVKALTLNPTFIRLLQEHRNEFGIPINGFNYEKRDEVSKLSCFQDFDIGYPMLHLYRWPKLDEIYINDQIIHMFGYYSLFNRVPIILNTHLSWFPDLQVEEDEYNRFKHILKLEHRFLSIGEMEKEQKGKPYNMLDLYENELLISPYADYPTIAVRIHIDSPLTLNGLIRFLKSEWKDIEYYIKKMKTYNDKTEWQDFFISDRDLEIVELHRIENKTFKQIADYFETKGDFSLYEDVVKTAYHRAIKKIDDLIRPQE